MSRSENNYLASVGHPDLMQHVFRFGLLVFWEFIENIRRLMHRAALHFRRGEDLGERLLSTNGESVNGAQVVGQRQTSVD